MNEDLNKIKQFESTIKAYLMQEFGKFLPEDKVSLLNAKSYAEGNFNSQMEDDEIKGEITRNMLRDLINVECYKDMTTNDGETIQVYYGENLEDALIEYYAQNLSEKYGLNIDEFPELKEDLETIQLLNEKLSDSFDPAVFNSDAIKLLEKAEFKELIEKCDEEALKKYFEKNKAITAGIEEGNKEQENEIMKQSTTRENAVQIVWLDGKKYIKYINPEGDVSLTEAPPEGPAEDFYKKELLGLNPEEKLDPEKFKEDLSSIATEERLTETKDVNPHYLNHQQIDMLNFVKSRGKVIKEAEKDKITHNDEMNIHVIESTNDIITTKPHAYTVEAHIVKDGEVQADREGTQEMEDISSKILSKEEYQELIDRFANGEDLTKEELESLKRTSEAFIDKGETLEDIMNTGGTKLTPYKNNPYGFSLFNLTSLLVTIFAIFSLILSIYVAFFYR